MSVLSAWKQPDDIHFWTSSMAYSYDISIKIHGLEWDITDVKPLVFKWKKDTRMICIPIHKDFQWMIMFQSTMNVDVNVVDSYQIKIYFAQPEWNERERFIPPEIRQRHVKNHWWLLRRVSYVGRTIYPLIEDGRAEKEVICQRIDILIRR